MLKKMHDWFRIHQILKTSKAPGDDILQEQVYKHVGDYFMERQKWYSLYGVLLIFLRKEAANYYEHSQNYAELAKCYLMLDDFDQLEQLSHVLPDGNTVLKQLGEIFSNYGLCEQAVDCYIRVKILEILFLYFSREKLTKHSKHVLN